MRGSKIQPRYLGKVTVLGYQNFNFRWSVIEINWYIVLELVPFRGKKLFGPHPQNRILVPFRVFIFIISDDHLRHFYMGVPPPGPNIRKSGFCCRILRLVD